LARPSTVGLEDGDALAGVHGLELAHVVEG
jgi:hypothetical protein